MPFIKKMNRLPKDKWVVHHIGYMCNNNCKFCIVQDRLNRQNSSLSELLADIELVDWTEKYYFTGGEPTLNENLSFLMDKASEISNGVYIQTNGRRFSDKNFLKGIPKHRFKGVMVSLHSHSPETTRFLAGSESCFYEARQGIENLLKEGVEVVTNTVISRYTLNEVEKTINFITRSFNGLSRARLVYASFNPYNNPEHYLPLGKIKSIVRKQLDLYGSLLEVENIPLCLVDSREYGSNFSDGSKLVALAQGKLNPNTNQRKYLEECSECSARKDCCGLYKHYDAFFDSKKDLKRLS